ncbi:MAG: TonB family protein [Desulfosarcinaceae bacterium]
METYSNTKPAEQSGTELRNSTCLVRHVAVPARLLAAVAAIGLNAALFAAMPYLQHPAQARPQLEQPLSQVEVVRLKRPETAVKRSTDLAPEEPPQARQRPKPLAARSFQAKLALPLAINPKLPAGPDTISLPDLAPAEFDAHGFGEAFAIGDLDAPLTVLTRMPPVYPAAAKHRGIEGWVKVRFVVNEDGRVGQVSILESRPPAAFDKSVIQCVSAWRFKPGTIDGMAVSAWAETTVRFKLR